MIPPRFDHTQPTITMSKSEKLLSVAEVFELPAGSDETPVWVNDFAGVVSAIKAVPKKAGGNFYKVTLTDPEGSAEVEMSMFTVPKFGEGDTIEVSGGGHRRTEYKGNAQVSLSKKVVINIAARGAHRGAPAAGSPPPREPASHTPPAGGGGSTPPPAASGHKPIYGGSVGFAMKEAIALVVMESGGVPAMDCTDPEAAKDTPRLLDTREFWARVKSVSSSILRISAALEAGKLSPAPWGKSPEEKAAEEAAAKAEAERAAGEAKLAKEAEDMKREREAKAAAKAAPRRDAIPGDPVDDGEVPF